MRTIYLYNPIKTIVDTLQNMCYNKDVNKTNKKNKGDVDMFNAKEMKEVREMVIADLIGRDLEMDGFEFVGRGVDGLVLANAEGRTVVLKVIVKKEVGIHEDLVGEFEDKEKARIEREATAKAKKEKAIAKKKEAEGVAV